MSLELGGNAPFIVFEDADLSASIEGTMAAKSKLRANMYCRQSISDS